MATNTKNTKGQITKFGNNADLAGLDDGTSKLHSGILKALFAIGTGNYVSALGANGITQGQSGGYTRFTVNGDIVFYRNGERFVISGNLTLDYGSGDAADSTTDRYDFLVLKSDNTLGFRKGSITGSDTNVGVLEDKDVPIAIIKVNAGADADSMIRHLQLFTAVDGDKSISITNSAADLTGDSIIQNLLVDKDIVFKGNDNNGTNGANISALTLDMSEAGKALFNVGAAFQKDVTIYEDANDADVSLSLGTSAAESLTISVLNGSSNKTAEVVSFATATASATANHGKMVFDVDGANIATIDDGGIDLAAGKTFSINGTDLTSSPITALNNATANELVTVGSTTTELDAEANLTFDGSTLAITGAMTASTTVTADQHVTGTIGLVSGGTFSATGYEICSLAGGAHVPVPTMAKHIIYSHDHSGGSNAWVMPNAINGNVYYIKNIFTNPLTITMTGGETVDLGIHAGNGSTVPCVTALNTITLAPQQSVTLHGVNDSQAPLTPGFLVIATA